MLDLEEVLKLYTNTKIEQSEDCLLYTSRCV